MPGLLRLVLLCMGTAALRRSVLIQQNKNWTEAQAYCRQHHVDLLRIRNADENGEITQSGWIGLYRWPLTSDWKWSGENTQASFVVWDLGEPDLGQFCVMKKSGVIGWHSKFCHYTYEFYCEDKPFVLVKEKKTWEEAQEFCRSLTDQSYRYELASPLTPDDLSDLQEFVQSDLTEVWIGLRFLGDEWSWMNGQIYEDFSRECPRILRCGIMQKNATLKIRKENCHEELSFVCSRESITG